MNYPPIDYSWLYSNLVLYLLITAMAIGAIVYFMIRLKRNKK